jgi:hypothetical protein
MSKGTFLCTTDGARAYVANQGISHDLHVNPDQILLILSIASKVQTASDRSARYA